MQNYEELTKRIYNAKSTMNVLLEFVEKNPCGEDCSKCTKLKIKQTSAFSTGFMAGMFIGGFTSMIICFYLVSVMLPGGAA